MGRVLVVSRNPGMAMGLSATDHEVVDVRPAAFDSWVDDSRDEHIDGVVLDLTDADSALHAITELRAHAQMAPVLVVPGDGPGWEEARMRDLPAAAVLARPVTNPLLRAAVERLVADGAASLIAAPQAPTPAEAAAAEEVAAADAAAADAESTAATANASGNHPAPPLPTTDREDIAVLLERLTAAPSVVHPPVVTPAAAPPTVSAAEVAMAPRRRTDASAPSGQGDQLSLVRSLMRVAHELYSLPETAEAVVRDAVERLSADAGALLIPDGARWRVAAGVGLRPLEHRYELTEDDWLVLEVARGARSVVMEDTDIVRQPLRGSPLASWHHLVAAPIRGVEGVLLIARDADPAFSQGDVETLAGITDEAAPLIATSLDVRELARRVEHLRDSGG